MKIIVQDSFKNLIDFTQFEAVILNRLESVPEADVAIGSVSFFSDHKEKSLPNYRILVVDHDELSIQDICFVQPFHVQKISDTDNLMPLLIGIEDKMNLRHKAKVITKEIQKKRRELEILNEQLVSESKVQFQSLEKSNFEEMDKNQNEKSLLYFLDFISSESLNDDFVSQILKMIWKEIKKMGFAYQIGFCFENLNDTVSLISYNGIREKSDTVQLDIKTELNTSKLATAVSRPVGKILSWKLAEFSRNGYFFVESIDQQLLVPQLESYFKERLISLSLYFDRWLIEKEYHLLIERWDRTFKSFSGFTHVVDEEYNIHQSNYLKKSETGKKCYAVLAGQEKPCDQCPIQMKNKDQISSTEFFLTKQRKVRVSTSKFNQFEKIYYFMFYEDMTNLDLLKSKMIQSEKMATVGRLGNHLSHELNNPLTGLKLYTQLLLGANEDEGVSPSIKADLTEILKASERCEKIIKNLLQFSQQNEIELKPLFFEDVLDSTLTLLKTALRPHRLFVDLKKQMILADSTALQQVIFNILKNACQAMGKPGSIKIFHIETADRITYCFQDSGPGLSVAVANLFSPFVTTKKIGEGTGLGLYLSKKLINRMSAEININQNYKSGLQVDLVFKKL